jgi:hypothetical protein
MGWVSPTVGTTWLFLAVAVPVALVLLSQTPAIDLAYQIRAGNMMLEERHVLASDAFSFTAHGQYWLNQQWGAQILLALAYRLVHWSGLALLRAALVGISMALVFFACRARGARARSAALLTVAGYLVGAQVMPQLRPQEFGVVLFAISQWAITTRARHPKRIWLVPPSVLLWANIHGTFPLVFLLLAFAWLEDRRNDRVAAKRTLSVSVISLVLTAIGPFGLRVWSYIGEVATHPAVRQMIGEWAPPTIRSWTGRAFLVSVFAVVVVIARRDQRVAWLQLLQLGVFAGLGFAAGRGVVWWGLAAPVIVAGLLDDADLVTDSARSSLNGLLTAVVALAVVVAAFAQRGIDPVTRAPSWISYAPQDLVAAVQPAVPSGTRAFVSEPYASWVELRDPDLMVAVDPRIEVFPEAVWDDYTLVSSGREGWQEVLDRWGVDVLILHPGDASGLLNVIGSESDWRLLRTSLDGSVYVRSTEP